jgi:hypothetical protein
VSADSGEGAKERTDRELIELLNELRVALPGVQTLFAFLLIVPFSNGWQQTTDFQRGVYLVAVLSTALSALLLIAPAAHHRLEFRERDREGLLRLANRLAIGGNAALAVAMSAAVFLILDVILGRGPALALGALTAVSYPAVWFLIPLLRNRAGARER